jgi:hypothetical protein
MEAFCPDGRIVPAVFRVSDFYSLQYERLGSNNILGLILLHRYSTFTKCLNECIKTHDKNGNLSQTERMVVIHRVV